MTPEILWKLKHVAASFYADELAKEPLTKEMAGHENARTVLQEEAVVEEAKRIIFDAQRERFTDFEVKHTEMVNQTNQSAAPTSKKEKNSETTPFVEQTTPEEKDEESKTIKDILAYLKNPNLDEPSEKVGAYIWELWNRPF